MTEIKDGRHGHTDSSWLMRSTLWPMVFRFAELSFEYDLDWVWSWEDHLDDLDWVRRAMANTYSRLSDEDKESIRYEYELFLEHDKFCDWMTMTDPSFDALCFILDGQGRRVDFEGVPVTVVKELHGSTKDEAIENLDRDCYEFIEWM